jgi:hypothetical protein
LSGLRLAEIQRRFEKAGVIIIDEKSMIGQEVFWMISERLKEARPEHHNEPFGALSVVLLGDWRQLPPVCDSPLFSSATTNPRGYNLYQLFNEVIIFDEQMRQQGKQQALFRKELKSLGDGTFSQQSWYRWRLRSLHLLPPSEQEEFRKNATLACALKKDMVHHNVTKVKSNNEPIAPIFAVSCPKEARKESSERSSGLVSKIILSRKTTIRLTFNAWTKAGLTNGAKGTVFAIIYAEGVKPPSLPEAIIVIFPDYTGPSYLPGIPNAVPIVPVKRDWFCNRVHCYRVQLPVILGYAITIHKLQGSTCDKLILNPGPKEFASGLLLVGASRTKTFEGLAFYPFPNFARFKQVNNSKALKKRVIEEKRMEKLQIVTLEKYKNISTETADETIENPPLASLNDAKTALPLRNVTQPLPAIHKGLTWGTGQVTNSCSVDNFFTFMSIFADDVIQFIGTTETENHLSEIVHHIQQGREEKGKEIWCKYLIAKQGAQGLLNRGQYNLWASERESIFRYLLDIHQINCKRVCYKCKLEEEYSLKAYSPRRSITVQDYLENLIQHLEGGTCRTCQSYTASPTSAKFTRLHPWLFVVDVEGINDMDAIKNYPKETTILKHSFKLAYISLYKNAHYTALFWLQDGWNYYDGMENLGILRNVQNPSQEFFQHIPINIVYVR